MKRPPSRRGRPGPPPPAAAEVTIETIGADGDGIAAHPDGARLYVPFTVPGDRILAKPGTRRGEGWSADAVSFLEFGPGRRTPVCRHFGVCGGCVAQHWNDDAYLAWKVDRLTSALRRAGFADAPAPVVVPGAAGTRRRMDLAARRIPGGFVLGLHQARGTEIVDLTECSVLEPVLAALIAPLRPVLNSTAAIRREASVVVNLLDSGPDILLRTDFDLSLHDRERLIAFARTADVPRIAWALGEGAPETVCELRPPVVSLSGVEVAPPPGAFLQAARAGEAAIVAAVLDGLPAKLVARSRAVDLFAGCGTIGFALAARLRVLAVEGDADLVAACHTASNRAGLMGRLEVRRQDLARQPFVAKELSGFDVAVLDPPHAGAAAQIAFLAAARVPTVIYVSCDPISLGRDAAVLHGAGYRLDALTLVDQFPWSARVEAAAVFRVGKK